jgi:hypothetical protein
MFTKAILGLAVILATASGALAATKTYNVDPSHPAYTNVYNPSGATSAQIRISTSAYRKGKPTRSKP